MPQKAPAENLTLAELLSAYPDDAAAERLFVSRRWPDGITCPSCGGQNIQEDTAHPEMAFRCRACDYFFFGTHGNRHAPLEDRLPGLADRHAPGAHDT